ncbi:MAG: alpha-amylase family glycosyl hydrolase, partial [Candidatus Sericytochromatia bacterium]
MSSSFRRHSRRLLGLLLASAALAGCHQGVAALPTAGAELGEASASARTRSLEAWKDEIIYFVLTDRFYNGNKKNDYDVRPNDPHAYHGGDLEGVIKKLDYLKDLGATAIWITPVNENKPDALVGKYWGFHGYWIHDFNKVDRHLGDDATF